MPNLLEIQVIQKERLFDLLMFKKANEGVSFKGLSRLISRAKAGMSKEDIAYVEQLVEQEDDF
ncbi:MAG: hypothetical protein FWF78_10955 [Defluviitaleaceae bacterium]|nr:hypothetical protein [Defluviitaleaceae bacterium]